MSEYIKLFDTTTEYNTYFDSIDFKSPNVSLCKDNSNIYYNPKGHYVTAKYTKQPNVKLINNPNLVTKMWIDGVLQSKVVSECTFSDSGVCTIKYVLTSIGNYAFDDCSSLTSIAIPNSVTSIGSYAFDYCSGLTSMTIPSSMTSIDDYAFYGCTSLTSVTIEATTPPLTGKAVFDNTKNCPIFVPSSSVNAYKTAWSNYALRIYAMPIIYTASAKLAETTSGGSDGLHTNAFNTNIISHTFENGVGTIIFNGDVTSIGDSAFAGCSGLTSITIPNSVTSIGDAAFNGCSGLTSISIPNSVTSIGRSAFPFCSSLTSITIPNGVTSIGYFSFYSCSSLTSVTIPSSVTNIGNYAFNGCSSLTNVYCKSTIPPTSGVDVFKNNAEGRKIYVPDASVDAYKAAENWSTYAADIEAMPR